MERKRERILRTYMCDKIAYMYTEYVHVHRICTCTLQVLQQMTDMRKSHSFVVFYSVCLLIIIIAVILHRALLTRLRG